MDWPLENIFGTLAVLAGNETFYGVAFSRSTIIMRKFWRSAAECLAASLVLVALTVICDRLHINIATAGLLCVVVVVMVSRVGSFVPSIFAAIIAALCLAYIAPPAFSFRVDDPFDIAAIFTFLVASLVIAGLVSKVRKHAEDALSSVSYRVIEAEEQERHRIAIDLHEDIGQRLTLLLSAVRQLKDSPSLTADVSSRVDAVAKQNAEILTDVKALAHELYSPRLEYLDIAGVMSSFCRDFGKRKGVEIDFRSDGLPQPRLPEDIALCLLRVLQEALLNAVKHSGVRHFDVRFSGTSDEIHLTVSDCGVGFDLEAARKSAGLGLNRIQERLKLVKGQLAIDSQRQIGTTIHARVPLNSKTKTNSVVA